MPNAWTFFMLLFLLCLLICHIRPLPLLLFSSLFILRLMLRLMSTSSKLELYYSYVGSLKYKLLLFFHYFIFHKTAATAELLLIQITLSDKLKLWANAALFYLNTLN